MRGFTLIEVLVALLIVAVGVLGIVALQFRSLQYSYDAYLRSQINFLAYDISEKIRMNRDNLDDYDDTDEVSDSTTEACDPLVTGNAQNDINCWTNAVDETLPPDSPAQIDVDANNIATVTMGWTDRDGTDHTVTFTFQP